VISLADFGERRSCKVSGASRADISALSKAIVDLSRLALAAKNRITALDINPLVVLPEGRGVLAVDALVHVEIPRP